jgi:hypothetical protein
MPESLATIPLETVPGGLRHREEWPIGADFLCQMMASELVYFPDQAVVAGMASAPPAESAIVTRLAGLEERLARMEADLKLLIKQHNTKDWYTPAEAAAILGKTELTVREWCRLGRVHAQKRACGRGLSRGWIISHAELDRIRNHGLLPVPPTSTRVG